MTPLVRHLAHLHAMRAENLRVQKEFPGGDWWEEEVAALDAAIASLSANLTADEAKLLERFLYLSDNNVRALLDEGIRSGELMGADPGIEVGGTTHGKRKP